jgi:hypothetical protein
MKKQHIFNFGKLTFFNSHAIIQCNDGVNIDFKEVSEIQEVLYHFFGDVYFGLIANRKNPYSVNPIAINELFSHKQLIAGAIVSTVPSSKFIAKIENNIVESSPIQFFTEMDSAIDWINDCLSNNIEIDNT